MTETDESIAAKVQAGKPELFGDLIDRYEGKLRRYGRRFLATDEDVEDIVQDVFIAAYENIQGFDTSARFSPWIYRIAHNAFVGELRKRSRSYPIFDFDTFIAGIPYDDPAQRERELRDIRAMLDTSLEKLSPKYREVLILYYEEELSYKEIADVLRVPVGTVGVRIKRAREALATEYKNML